jgi:hypothetical protein
VTLKAIKGIDFIRIGCPRSDICSKYLTTTSSSYGLSAVGLALSLSSRVVRDHDDGVWYEGRCRDLQEHGMIWACQEARLAPIPRWPCPYYRRDGGMEGDEGASLGRPRHQRAAAHQPMEGSRTCFYAKHVTAKCHLCHSD